MLGDELDITTGAKAQKEDASMVGGIGASADENGIGMMTKLVLFCLVLGVFAAFLKTRRGHVTEKSLA